MADTTIDRNSNHATRAGDLCCAADDDLVMAPC
jgi:hypothetical protein